MRKIRRGRRRGVDKEKKNLSQDELKMECLYCLFGESAMAAKKITFFEEDELAMDSKGFRMSAVRQMG